MKIELVKVMDLAFGDRILLDDGSEVEVKGTELGRHKDQMIIRLRHAQPLYVNGYWEPFIRRTHQAPKSFLRMPEKKWTLEELMTEKKLTLEELSKRIKPNPNVLKKNSAFCDLLSLVVEEYVLVDMVSDLTKEERYEIAHWASLAHIAAGLEDPPLPRPVPPASLTKVVLMPGRRVIVEGHGPGVVGEYGWGWIKGTSQGLPPKRPEVKLDCGFVMHPELKEIIGVE